MFYVLFFFFFFTLFYGLAARNKDPLIDWLKTAERF